MTIKTFVLAAAATAALGGAAGAQTLPGAGSTTYDFSGKCADGDACSGYVSGKLELTGYSPPDTLQFYEFDNFTYTSSVYTPSIEISPGGEIMYNEDLQGQLGKTSGSYNVSFSGKTYGVSSGATSSGASPQDTVDPDIIYQFSSDTTGAWSLTANGVTEDTGSDGVWSPEGVSGAPEPGTWALMLGGVAAAGGALQAARRRRAIATA